MKKPRFIKATYFYWIGVYVAGFAFIAIAGTPHFLWRYNYHRYALDNGGHARYYTMCQYVGKTGEHRLTPNDGKCSWLIFRKGKSS